MQLLEVFESDFRSTFLSALLIIHFETYPVPEIFEVTRKNYTYYGFFFFFFGNFG